MVTRSERDDRRISALRLRRAGAQYTDIARALGVSLNTAWKDVQSALTDTLHEEAGALRDLQSQRCDDLLRGLWPQAIAGNTSAVTAAVRVMERQARLYGLDAQQSVAVSIEYRDAYAAEFERLVQTFPIASTP